MAREKVLEENRANGGYSFRTAAGWYLMRCHECGRENYSLAVATGRCCWCGTPASGEGGSAETTPDTDAFGVSAGRGEDGG